MSSAQNSPKHQNFARVGYSPLAQRAPEPTATKTGQFGEISAEIRFLHDC